MKNELKHALGDRPNSEFVISPTGEVLIARSWSDPVQLRKDLEKLVGKAETLTEPSNFSQSKEAAEKEKAIASGVVPRVDRPANGVILKTSAKMSDDQPLYVKLRAEASTSLLKGDVGTLHLGFHIDPIHKVHWNNLASPLKYILSAPESVSISKREGVAAKIEDYEADSDPREFLIEIDPGGKLPDEPLVVRVDYFACDDNDEWCKAASQEFQILWERDPDAGTVRAAGARPSGGKSRPNQATFSEMVKRMDQNGDGSISKAEAKGPFKMRFDQMDQDGDGSISPAEIEARAARRR